MKSELMSVNFQKNNQHLKIYHFLIHKMFFKVEVLRQEFEVEHLFEINLHFIFIKLIDWINQFKEMVVEGFLTKFKCSNFVENALNFFLFCIFNWFGL